MAINPNYKKKKVTSGDLRTLVTFFEYKASDGPEPGDEEKEILFETMAEVYNPSMKDFEIMNAKGTKEAVTINIRDTRGAYLPSNKHKAVLNDYRYENKVWEIVDVRNDLKENEFIKIILGVSS